MRKVLIIAYYWPPAGGGGVQRWLKFTKYLPEFGWDPIVYVPYNPQYPLRDSTLTEKVPDHVQVIKGHIWEARRIYRRLKKFRHGSKWSAPTEMDTLFFRDPGKLSWFGRLSLFLRSNMFVPDSRSLWIRPSVRRLRKWLSHHPVDLIISTGPPHSCHLIGMKLMQRTGIPWIADFRDPWTDIDYFPQLMLTKRNRRRHERLEHEVLSNAAHVVTVSPSWAGLLKGYGARNVTVITNGFDPPDIPTPVHNQKDDSQPFRITSIGTLEADRAPEGLWEALNILVQDHPEVSTKLQLHFAGKVDPEILPQNTVIKSMLHLHGYVAHADALKQMAQADVLLLILNLGSDNNTKGRIPGKLFEYMAMRKPIILLGPSDSDASRMVASLGNSVSHPHDAIEAISQSIFTLYSTSGKTDVEVDLEMYKRRVLTSRLAGLMHLTISA